MYLYKNRARRLTVNKTKEMFIYEVVLRKEIKNITNLIKTDGIFIPLKWRLIFISFFTV